jgi:hypothetical protein
MHAQKTAGPAAAMTLRTEPPARRIRAVPGQTGHSPAAGMPAAGRPDGVLRRAASGDAADGGLW